MTNNDKQFYIYLRATKEQILVTEHEFKAYYKDIDTFRKKQQRHGKCVCPASKRLSCDMDCNTCPFRRAGDSLSLNYTVKDDEGNEHPWLDDLTGDENLLEEIVSDGIELQRIFARIQELMPEAIEVGKYRLDGLSDVRIAELIGIKNTTTRSRLEKLKKTIFAEFSDFFEKN